MDGHAADGGDEPGSGGAESADSRPGASLTHLDADGRAHMVDVSAKGVTPRRATASGMVRMAAATQGLVLSAGLPKGDVFGVARVAAIQAVKRTAELIPLCHPLPVTGVGVEFAAEPDGIRVVVSVATTDRTGVEMEALTGVAVACLTIYDMCKAVDRGIVIDAVRLETKSGGRSGDWSRSAGSGDVAAADPSPANDAFRRESG